jgi:hypothetical protein
LLKDASLGEFADLETLTVRKEPESTVTVEDIDGVKTILVANRADRESGICLHLGKIPELIAGDRLTITGRVEDGTPHNSNWSIALLSIYDGYLTQHISPRSVFSLSYVLTGNELEHTFFLQTIGWGAALPTMSFYIDSILITRMDSIDTEGDTRGIVYSLADGEGSIVTKCGNATIRFITHENKNALHITKRESEFDGIDINLLNLKLHKKCLYKIIVRGKIDGNAPLDSAVMLQGIPSQAWRCITIVNDNDDFTLEYTLRNIDIELWTSVRVITNTQGRGMSFFIYDIEVINIASP